MLSNASLLPNFTRRLKLSNESKDLGVEALITFNEKNSKFRRTDRFSDQIDNGVDSSVEWLLMPCPSTCMFVLFSNTALVQLFVVI